MLFLLGLIIGMLFTVIAIITGILLSKKEITHKLLQKIDNIVLPKGSLIESPTTVQEDLETILEGDEDVRI